MAQFEYQKIKTAGKEITVKGDKLSKIVLDTMKIISDVVGATLGPGGQPVLIERFEHALGPYLTKDGVSVMRALGFQDPTMHCILELVREAAVKTVQSAGDGPQPLWSKVLTPNGFVEMRDIKVGTDICGTNGTIQKVIGVFPKGKKEIIKIILEQNQVVECCEDHLWTVITNYGSQKTITTKEIMQDYKSYQGDGHFKYKYFVPQTGIEFDNNQDLPLLPYIVGLLIGDGSLTDTGSIELSCGIKKEHIFNKIVLPEGLILKIAFSEAKNYFRAKISGKNKKGEDIRQLLENIGLRNTNSHTKFIPKTYLLSSKQNREALLQGLIDTDGYINNRGLFEFSTTSEQLADDFKFLCRSLGKNIYSTHHHRKEGDGSYSARSIYRFSELKGCNYGVKIKNIDRTGMFTEMQCIKVSNSDQLYITDDFILTHNTTTATILAEAIVRLTNEYCKKNPQVSPQKVVRIMDEYFKNNIVPHIQRAAIKANLSDDHGKSILKAVAKVSANGDEELAKAVLDCFELCGDEGNVTIIEAGGPVSKYEVEVIDGYPIMMGYEVSCRSFYSKFINDTGTQSCKLDKPVFILYYGELKDINVVLPLLQKIGMEYEKKLDPTYQNQPEDYNHHNVVIVATGFSEMVLGTFAANFPSPGSINIYPLLVPDSPMQNGKLQFLEDLSSITGATIFDSLNKPLDLGELHDLGPGLDAFEANRWRSIVFGRADESLILERVMDLQSLLENPFSELDSFILKERIAKLTGGIAKLKIVGASSGETKEKRDRAEDAICAVKGAIKNGCLPGGGRILLELCHEMLNQSMTDNGYSPVIMQILEPALRCPIERILNNCGMNQDEINNIISILWNDIVNKKITVYDALEYKFGSPYDLGIFDSLPAVLEAIKNSLSIASRTGTLGAIVNFPRDYSLERNEASKTQDYMNNTELGERMQKENL